MPRKRVRAYIDGFNLYYGALRRTGIKWVDFEKLVTRLVPECDVDRVLYFTARVAATAADPDVDSRQDTFFRALKAACPHLEFVEGKFRMRTVAGERVPARGCICCEHSPGQPCACCESPVGRIKKPEEKGSDVNLGVRLVADAYQDLFDSALVVSNDSDLQLAVDIVRWNVGKAVTICDPRGNRSPSLHGSSRRTLRAGALAACQLPIPVIDGDGREIRPPTSWLRP